LSNVRIQLDLELTDPDHHLVGQLTPDGEKRSVSGWLQLIDELQRALQQPGSDHTARNAEETSTASQ
jgi:hypothetical protein